MPVSFTNATDADPQFLTPAPFININKSLINRVMEKY